MSISVQRQSYKSKLIESVRQNPDLWQVWKKAPGLKQKLWTAVGKKLGTSGCDARRQWEILRDQFRREFKRCRSDGKYKSRWIHYNRMLFMRDTLRARDGRTSDTDDRQSPLDVSQIVEQNLAAQAELPKIQVRKDLQPTEFAGEPSTSSGVSSSSGNCHQSSPQQRRRRRWRPESTDDEDYYFVMSILPSLQCLHQAKKLRVRAKIMEFIATELESGEGDLKSSDVSHFQVKSEPEESDADEKSYCADRGGGSDY